MTKSMGIVRRSVVVLAIMFLNCSPNELRAQSVTPEFEVASIKKSDPSKTTTFYNFLPGGRFSATNYSLHSLIRTAWALQPDQLIGGPEWMKTEAFDIETRAEGNPPREQVLLMLRTLLAERFSLSMHAETRELPVYELVFARPDKQLGPSLRPSTGCADSPRSSSQAPCRALYSPSGQWSGREIPIRSLLSSLVRETNRVVIDRTDLPGLFDLELRWVNLAGALGTIAGGGSDFPTSFFTAVEEQWGLKLRSTRALVDVMVVEKVDQLIPD